MGPVGRTEIIDALDDAFDHVQIGLALISETTHIDRINPAGAGVLGADAAALLGRRFLELTHPEDRSDALRELSRLLEEGHAGPIVLRIARQDTEGWLWIRAHATLLAGSRRIGFVVFEDVTDELAVADALRTAEEVSSRHAAQQEAVAELGRVALTGVGPDAVARRACELVRSTLGVAHSVVLLDDDDPRGLAVIADVRGDHHRDEPRRVPRDGQWADFVRARSPLFIDDLLAAGPILPASPEELKRSGLRSVVGLPIVPTRAAPGALVAAERGVGAFTRDHAAFLEGLANVLATCFDSAQAREELRHQALHDALTGLPNRTLLVDHLELALQQAVRQGAQVAVFVCDLDRFKVVNDGLGHAAGDAVLRIVAQRLREHVRPGDTVGRFGGDEFVVVCPEVHDLPTVVAIAERLSAAIGEPMQIAGTRLVISGSLGIALGFGGGPDAANGVLRDADAAMYRAKSHGRARYELYDDAMRALASRRLAIETDLRWALAEDELLVHYQPVVTTDAGQLVGVEALVRWDHPEQGLVPPAEFLPVAEESGLLPAIGDVVLRRATAQAATWLAGPPWPRHWVAVNLDARELADPSLLRRVDGAVRDAGFDPGLLRVEITEDALLEDTLETSATLDALRRRGVGISIDDFGTGYSSLAYLKRLPVDSVKLDRAFVDGLGRGSRPDDGTVTGGVVDDTAIASAVVQMAASLQLHVVAEGVETEEQLAVLRRLGCEMVQGYLIARPMPAAELETWVAAQHARRS